MCPLQRTAENNCRGCEVQQAEGRVQGNRQDAGSRLAKVVLVASSLQGYELVSLLSANGIARKVSWSTEHGDLVDNRTALTRRVAGEWRLVVVGIESREKERRQDKATFSSPLCFLGRVDFDGRLFVGGETLSVKKRLLWCGFFSWKKLRCSTNREGKESGLVSRLSLWDSEG